MKKLKIFIALVSIILAAASCELPDNVNPKGASKVTASSLFSNAQVGLVDQLNSISVNLNVTRLFCQYNAQIIYVDEGNFNLLDRRIPDSYFEAFYRNVLANLKESRKILLAQTTGVVEAERENKIALIDILEVYSYQCLVDAFGNVPYTEALQGLDNPSPAYDDAQTIYLDLLDRLNTDLTKLDPASDNFGDNDILYAGDINKWILFANSLKLRIGMRISDVPSLAATAQTACEEAIAGGVITDMADNAVFVYVGVTPYTNSIYEEMVEGGRNDFVPAIAIVDYMVAINDPRLPLYFTMVDTSTEVGVEKLVYLGGNPGDQNNSWQSCSHFSDAMFEPDFPVILIDAAEVSFLLAEAAERSYTGAGDAETNYNEAVTASILEWGGDTAQANAYLALPEVAYDAANWKTSIGIQKWLALYNRGVEGWAEIRRLDIDDWTSGPLTRPAESLLDENPSRMPFPYVEEDVNKANKDAAATAIGGDEMTTRLFWDIDNK
jgi:hypothetical protein